MLLSIMRLVCLLGAVVLAGCTTSQRSREFAEVRLPGGGEPIEQEVWLAAEAAPPQTNLGGSTSTIWALPLNFHQAVFKVNPNLETATRSSLTWNDLLLPGFFLPVRLRYTEFAYDRNQAEPVAARRAIWTPFWAWTSKSGEDVWGSELTMRGIPLLFGQFSRKGSEGMPLDITVTHTLWTLGPFVAKLQWPDEDGVDQTRRGYFATPLLLTGLPGTILWSDYYFRDSRTSQMGHGPLWGLLGYTHNSRITHRPLPRMPGEEPDAEQGVEEIRSFSRLVLGGILWSDRSERVVKTGSTIESAHGPLWGMFGWGKKNDRFRVRFLFIPIG